MEKFLGLHTVMEHDFKGLVAKTVTGGFFTPLNTSALSGLGNRISFCSLIIIGLFQDFKF